MAEGVLGGSAARDGARADSIDLAAFREELARARRHVADLEEQYREAIARDRVARTAAPPLDENPKFAQACNAALWAVVALPFVLGGIMLVDRLIG